MHPVLGSVVQNEDLLYFQDMGDCFFQLLLLLFLAETIFHGDENKYITTDILRVKYQCKEYTHGS